MCYSQICNTNKLVQFVVVKQLISVLNDSVVSLQTSMNVCQMEEEVHVHRYVPTPLGHFSAAVSLDTHCLNMCAMVIETAFECVTEAPTI